MAWLIAFEIRASYSVIQGVQLYLAALATNEDQLEAAHGNDEKV